MKTKITVKLKTMTDKELTHHRNKLPNYKNYMTNDELEFADAIHREQMKRYNKKIEAFNLAAMGATGLKWGDKVERFVISAFGCGCGGENYIGKVIHNRFGRLVIRTKRPDGSGKKTFPINKAWTKIQ